MSLFKQNHVLLVFVAIISQIIVSCKSDKPDVIEEKPVITTPHSVYITNEGNFQFGNASVSYYKPSDNSIVEDVFKANNQLALGDVCQSINYHNGNFYIVVNNSHKIVIVNSTTFQFVSEITGFNSPRYLLPVSAQKGYVTDLYNEKISIIDFATNTITGYISCSGWTEAIAMTEGKVFVSNLYRDKLYVIDTQSDHVTDSIQVSLGGNSITIDKNGKIWLLCSGSSVQAGALCHINPTTYSVIHSYSFLLGANPARLKSNASKDTLYWINGNVFRMAITDLSASTTPFISLSGANMYGLGIDPYSNEIYVSDAIDYVQKGVVYRYNSNGILINSFRAGIIPGDFYFY